MKKKLRYGSLFTGIGVFDLAMQNEGVELVFACDNDPFCKLHYQEMFGYDKLFFDDVKQLDNIPQVDILMFGFPCQDISNAGNIKKENPLYEKRSGLFWDAMRIVRNSRPTFLIIENVSELRRKGLEIVLWEITKTRYSVGYVSLRASQFGGDHKRERIFILAYADSSRWDKIERICSKIINERTKNREKYNLERKHNRAICGQILSEADSRFFGTHHGATDWLYEGLRAKAIGNAIDYRVAQAVTREVLTELQKS